MKFISLKHSTKPNKKYVIEFSEPKKTIHFGSKNSSTYLNHKDKHLKANYLKRHQVNENWDEVNAGSLSAFLLWGPYTDINKILTYYLNKFGIQR
jgi:hypothetical protein